MRLESGEAIIGTSEGVVKARDFQKKPEKGGRWNKIDFGKFVGLPWALYPGAKGSAEMKPNVRQPQGLAEVTRRVKGKDVYLPRRFRIQGCDLENSGFAAGRPARRAANPRLRATTHSETRRARIQKVRQVRG